MIPPTPLPQPTIPIAVDRCFSNQWPETAAAGVQSREPLKPNRAWASRNW